MCGKNKNCGCSQQEQAARAAAHPEDAVEESTEAITASAPADTVVAAVEINDTTGLPSQWHAVLCVEGLRTTDHRMISPMALTWRQLPLVIDAQFENVHGFGDTPAAPIVGSITDIERDETTGYIMGTGTFDLGSEPGREAARMCLNQTLR